MFSRIYNTIRTHLASLRTRQLSLFEVSTIFILSGVAFVIVYTLYTQEALDPRDTSPQQAPTILMPIDPIRESTLEQKQTELTQIESNLMLSDTEYERLAYSLQKAFALITTNNRTSTYDEAELTEARTLFSQVYEGTKDKPSQKLLMEKSLWGYLFYFASTGYRPDVIEGMPSTVRNAYFSEWNNPEIFSEDEFQKRKKIFEGMIAFISDDTLFSNLKDEKSFNAYSAMVKAVYIDSFKESFSSDEMALFVESLNKNLTRYEQGVMTDDLPPTSLRLAVVVPTHIAFARYIVDGLQNPDISSIQYFHPITEHINNQNDTDPFGRDIVLARIKRYELSAGVRANIPEEQIAIIVQALRTQLEQRPDIQPILKRTFVRNLSEEEQWNAVNRDLKKLQENSPSFKEFLSSLGIES